MESKRRKTFSKKGAMKKIKAGASQDETNCALKFVPNSLFQCGWTGSYRYLAEHFKTDHMETVHVGEWIVLEPEQARVAFVYSDLFLCYLSFHKGDLVCIALHLCGCNLRYSYRCTLISQIEGLPNIEYERGLFIKRAKKFKSIRRHSSVIRFNQQEVIIRKKKDSQIQILFEILRTTDQTAFMAQPIPVKAHGSTLNYMDINCTMNSTLDGITPCFWRDLIQDFPTHLRSAYGNDPSTRDNCISNPPGGDVPVCYDPLNAGSLVNLAHRLHPDFQHIHTYRSHRSVLNYSRQTLCCCCMNSLQGGGWHYGWMCNWEAMYTYMWDAFRPTVHLSYNVVLSSMPLTGIHPYYFSYDLATQRYLNAQPWPCAHTWMNSTCRTASNGPNAPKSETDMMCCGMNYVPGINRLCDWIGPWNMMYQHLREGHSEAVILNDNVVLHPKQPRVLLSYRDVFICYATYDKGDLVCVVTHACPCKNIFKYRCALLSENKAFLDIIGQDRFVGNECADFKSICNGITVTRFSSIDIEPRKSKLGNIIVLLKMFAPLGQESKFPPPFGPKFYENAKQRASTSRGTTHQSRYFDCSPAVRGLTDHLFGLSLLDTPPLMSLFDRPIYAQLDPPIHRAKVEELLPFSSEPIDQNKQDEVAVNNDIVK